MKNKSSQNKGVNLVITLYNENSKNRCLELFFCLKSNIENEHISKIHILYEDPDKDSFLFDIIANINSEKIIIQTITKRPTYNEIFCYCDNNIVGPTIIANSDIVFNETLDNLKFLQKNDFISLTRYQKYNNKFKLIHLPDVGNKINIFSQDSWMFISPLKYKIDCPIEIGTMFCDSLINYVLSSTKYKCYNLYDLIKSYHVQSGISESEKMAASKEILDNRWQYVYELTNKTTTNFLYGLRKNTLLDFKNKENYNNFINWDDFWHSTKEDLACTNTF
jgi:hypothetical protein